MGELNGQWENENRRMSMIDFINNQLDKAIKEDEHNYDPGDYAQCESCNALNMRDCLECPVASYDGGKIEIKWQNIEKNLL